MTRAAAALAIIAVTTAACTAPGGTPGQRSPGAAQSAGTSSYVSADADGNVSPVASAPGMTSPAPTAIASPAPPATPGGTGNIAALVASGDLASGGKIDLYGQGTTADGEAPDPAATANLCHYLFGSTNEVAEAARLSGRITLDPISGRHPADGASDVGADPGTAAGATPTSAISDSGSTADEAAPILIACVYRSDGAPVLALQVGDGPPVDPNLPGSPIIVDGDGLHAVLSYSPDHHGTTIAPAKAREWLAAVIDRVAPVPTGTR